MIDFWELAKDFRVNDTVQKFIPGGPGTLSPFVGRVTSVHPGLGCVDVQWPFGPDRASPDELVRVNPALLRYLPPTLNQFYSSYDTEEIRTAAEKLWSTKRYPKGFHYDLAKLWHHGQNEIGAYDGLWRRYASQGADDEAIKTAVGQFYRVAFNLSEYRIQQHALRTAAYWVAQDRQYRVSQEEITAKKPMCPKCGAKMRKTTYKMDKGARHKLWACPKDLFLIKVDHLLGPQGEPVIW